MNSKVLHDYLPYFAEGALVTVRVAAVGIVVSLAIGLVCAIVRYLKIPALRRIVGLYIELSRNTPLIVQLFFIFYGLPKAGILLSSEVSAIIGLSFLGGGYMAEAFRSGFDSIGKIQWESAQSLGMTPVKTMVHVIVPQALSRSVAALVANVIFLIKETSVVSVVALNDLVYVAREKIGNDYDTTEALFLLVVFYVAIILPVSLAGAYLERRVRRAEFGN